MSKHKGQPQSQAVQPANQTSPAATVAEPTPKTAMFVVNSISELIAQVEKAGGTLSPEAKAELEKMRSAQETLEAPKRLADAEADVTASLPKLLETIAGKHKVSFSGRKVVIVFKSTPKDGEPNPIVSFGPEVEVIASGKKRSGNGNGFKSHGAVVLHENGKDTMADSLHALVIGKGLKYEGRATAQVAITNPCTQAEWEGIDSDARKNLPTKYRIEPKTEDGKTVLHVYPITAS